MVRTEGNDDGSVFVALLLLSVFAFGNNCAYDVVSIVVANILERRRMIVPKENSGNKKKRDTNFVVIITA
ncbi:MAG: hypothetical protein WA667_02265 [Candidatus Nitrosopolaris sp.]